jgi:hypothetical protein
MLAWCTHEEAHVCVCGGMTSGGYGAAMQVMRIIDAWNDSSTEAKGDASPLHHQVLT